MDLLGAVYAALSSGSRLAFYLLSLYLSLSLTLAAYLLWRVGS